MFSEYGITWLARVDDCRAHRNDNEPSGSLRRSLVHAFNQMRTSPEACRWRTRKEPGTSLQSVRQSKSASSPIQITESTNTMRLVDFQ